MKILFATILTLSVIICKKSTNQPVVQNCNVFNQKSNSIDTIILRADYKGRVRLPRNSDRFLLYLEQKHVLRSDDFNSSIIFNIDGCNEEYNLACHDKALGKGGDMETDQKVVLTCIRYPETKAFSIYKVPQAIVIKIAKVK